MNDFDRALTMFTNIVTNPWTLGYILFGLSLPYLLKYIRRFYSKSVQEKIIQCEIKYNEYEESGLAKRDRIVMFSTTISVTILLGTTLLLLSLVVCSTITNDALLGSYGLAFISTVLGGISNALHPIVYQYIFKEEHPKQGVMCKSEEVILKYMLILAYLFIAFFIYGYIYLTCIGKMIGLR